MKISNYCLILAMVDSTFGAKQKRSEKQSVRGARAVRRGLKPASRVEFDGLSDDTIAVIKQIRQMMKKCHGRQFC